MIAASITLIVLIACAAIPLSLPIVRYPYRVVVNHKVYKDGVSIRILKRFEAVESYGKQQGVEIAKLPFAHADFENVLAREVSAARQKAHAMSRGQNKGPRR